MKKIISLLFLCLSLIASDQINTLGYLTNFDEAMAQAKKENKMVMLIMTKDGCPWCKKLKDRVLVQDEVNSRVKKEFVALILNSDTDKYPSYFETIYTPTTYFINAATKDEVWSNIGYANKKDFLQVLNDAHDAAVVYE